MSTSTDSSESTNRLRDKIRVYQSTERSFQRENERDSYRLGLSEISKIIEELENITEKDVTGLASRIKRRKHATADDLFRLSHAFLQSEQNIVTFMKIPGALNVIVKEFTGTDSKLQIIACEVLCNLSLGDEICCEKLAAAAGSYLITNLDSSESRLQRTSLWVISNILATDGKGQSIFISQEIVPKLQHLLLEKMSAEAYNDILQSIDILFDKNINIFSPEQCLTLRNHLLSQGKSDGIHLKILFTILFRMEDPLIDDATLPSVLSLAISTLNVIDNLTTSENVLRTLYATRILGNLISKFPNCYDSIDNEYVIDLPTELPKIINKFLSCNHKLLNREILWLVRNLLECETNSNKPETILNKLKISKMLVL